MDALLEKANTLPERNRQRIASRVEELIEEELHAENGWTLGEYYLDVMGRILGREVDNSRTMDNFYARVVIASCLYDEGYTQVMIGKVLGRNHSTIHYYLNTWMDAKTYPAAYAQLRWLHDKFIKAIDNDRQ